MLHPLSSIRLAAPYALALGASITVALVLTRGATPLYAEPFTYRLEEKGAPLTIAPSVQTNEESARTATLFAEVLQRITGSLPSQSESLERGIVFATATEFPEMAKEAQLDPADPFRREDYLLRTSSERLLVVGATPIAVRRAMADLLHRWGYRQFFPSPTWEIAPSLKELTLDIDEVQRPAFAMRDLFTTNFVSGEKERFERWRELNRMGCGFLLNTRHSYQAIYQRHQATFEAHPEFLAVVDGKIPPLRLTAVKFNAANDDLIQLLVKDAETQFRGPDAKDSLSMDPSDFGGWDNSGEAFKKLGKASNQAVTMANAVAKNVAAPLGKYVGMYAYYDHQFPPDIPVESNIIVSFATRFLRPGQDLYKNIEQWKEKGVERIGIRDYASVLEWDFGMPGRALGGNLAYIAEALSRYKKLDAEFYTSEMHNVWGGYGLGYYLTAQLLWNPEQESKALVDDFLQKAFGPASAPMATFFNRLNGDDSVLARYSSPARLYAPLVEALAAAKGDQAIEQRLLELLTYVRYTELFAALERSPLAHKQAVLEELYDLVFRAAPFEILPTRALALHPRGGLRRAFKTLSHRSQDACEIAITEATSRPLSKEELLVHAKAALAAPAPAIFTTAPLPQPTKATSSPWVRNSAAFTFVLDAQESLDVQILLRRYGFTDLPRYVVRGPEKGGGHAQERIVHERGQMRQEQETISLNAKAAGNYTLLFEWTPNLLRCSAPKPFYLNPTEDSGTLDLVSYSGSLYFTVPGEETAQIGIGGQGTKEKVFASIATNSNTRPKGRTVDGVNPMEEKITATKDAPEQVHITLRAPTEGLFEDIFLQFQGSFSAPISLSPLP